MQSHLSTIHAAAKTHSPDVPVLICRFLAAALDSDEKCLKSLPWIEVVEAMDTLRKVNRPDWEVPMIRSGSKQSSEVDPWQYIGGEWFRYWHLFAFKYGWSEDYIADLEIEKAFALMQEIAVDEQLQKEWEHSLSDRAVLVDTKTHTARLQPLSRPDWMRPRMKIPKKVVIRKSLMPVGPITGDSRLLEKLEIIDDTKNPDTE